MVLALLLATWWPVAATSDTGIIDTSTKTIDASDEAQRFNIRDGSVVVAPIPFSNPTIGSGLALGAGYLFTTDPNSKASMIGLGAFKSDNGSQGYGLSFNLYLNDNRWILKSLFAKADLNYDLYTGVGALPVRQSGSFARLSLAYGVTSNLSFGGTLQYLDTDITLNKSGFPAIPPPFDEFLGLKLLNLGVVVQWDQRDDSVYATTGSNLVVNAIHGTSLGGDKIDFQKAWATYDYHHPLGKRGVLVSRLATCATSTGTPFFEQCSLGGTDAFRGFSSTQYLDNRLASVQVEYRLRMNERLGLTLFGGAGGVGTNFSDMQDNGFHTAGGVGLRYRVSKKFPVDFSIDATRNDQNENLIYIYVGQRF